MIELDEICEKVTKKLRFPKFKKPKFKLEISRKKTKLSSRESITGNRYDLVLAVQPDARDNYDFYDAIVNTLEEKKSWRVYSPHNDFKIGKDLSEIMCFTVNEAISRTKGVLAHLTTVTPEIQEMFDASYNHNKPFILFYSYDSIPFSDVTYNLIRQYSGFKGEIVYFSEEDALERFQSSIELFN